MASRKKSTRKKQAVADKDYAAGVTTDDLDPNETGEEVSTTYANTDLEQEAIAIVRGEKQRWEVATAFVTDRVSFKMRQLIRILRKNYYGIFDSPFDPMTNLEKVWYPLTEINVEAVVKNIDLDQKDINFRSKTPNGYGITDLTRAAVKQELSAIYFGQKLDDFERSLAIDGTAVWKTYESDGKLIVQQVDLLNIYLDPTTPSIQEAYRFTERALMFPEEIKRMTGWKNTEDTDENVPEGLPRIDPYWNNRATQVNSNVRMLDVYELWGKFPKRLITGLRSDDNEEVEGHIVVSGIDSPGKERCHLIELNTKQTTEGQYLKPYEEAWYTRVPNRWYGRGIAEKLLMLQIYANVVFNVRINRSRVSQLGLFKVRKGAGITPQMLSRLPANGAIVLNNLDDLQQLVMSEVSEGSYKDEDVINVLSERLTNAFEVVTGERLPSSTPATNAAIQNQNAKSGFGLVKDGIAGFLTRWMDRHALPIIAKQLTAEKIIRITADEESFKELVDRVVNHKALEALDESYASGYIPSELEIQMAMDSARQQLLKGDMFVKLVQDIVADQLETEVYITNEEMDVAVTVQNLINMLNVAPEFREAIVKQTFDLMGLPVPQLPRATAAPVPMPGMPGMAPVPGMEVAGAIANGMPAPQQVSQLPGNPAPASTAALTR